MNLRSFFGLNGVGHERHDQVLDLADEVTGLIRQRAQDPLRKTLIELLLSHHHDPVLIADAFEASQESRIYKGPES